MGIFSGLAAESYDRHYSDRELVGRINTYFKPHQKKLILVAILLIVIAVTAAAAPVLVSSGLDLLVGKKSTTVVYLLAAAIFLMGLISWGANWIRRRLLARIVGDVVYTLQSDGFRAAAEHDLSFHDDYSSGRIVSRITSDTRDFGQLVTFITDLVSQFAQAFILGIALVRINWQLSLWVFGFMPVLFFAAMGFRRIARTVT
ncbi:MAG: ABC transporter transmembrane domain-containing protein, partial [Anaerolineales bacterium]